MDHQEPSPPPPAPPSPAPLTVAAEPPKPWRQVLRVAGRVLAAAWLLGACLVCPFAASFAPTAGGPIGRYLPKQALISARVRNGDEAWRALEAHPAVQALWELPELQARTHWREKLEAFRAKWDKQPALLKALFQPDRPGARFLVGGELAVVLEAPPPASDGERSRKPPLAVYLRLQGGRGALVRMGGWMAGRFGKNAAKVRAAFHDLGGGLIALALNGAEPADNGEAGNAGGPAVPEGTAVEIDVRPRAIRIEQGIDYARLVRPSWPEVFGLQVLPERIRIHLSATPDVLRADGEWEGGLPPHEPPARLLDDGLGGREPVLDARIPLDLGKLFARHLFEELQDGKSKRRWETRLAYLADAQVDLNASLWPVFGRVLRVQIADPAPGSGTGQPRVLASLPFHATPEARHALGELARVRWKGLYDDPPSEDADRPYVRRIRKGEVDRYILVRGSYTRPMWLTDAEGLAVSSDAGPFAMLPAPPLLARPAAPRDPEPCFELRTDGARLAPIAGMLAQIWLEEERDELGAAEFMERYPDEGAVVELIQRAIGIWGALEARLTPEPGPGAPRGRLEARGRLARPGSP